MTDSTVQFVKDTSSFSFQSDLSIEIISNKNPLIPIQRDLKWLKDYVSTIAFTYVKLENDPNVKENNDALHNYKRPSGLPEVNTNLPYDNFLKKYSISTEERLMICTALATYFSAGLLSVLSAENPGTNKPFAEFGGMNHTNNEFIPTIDTIRFLITNGDVAENYHVDKLLKENSKLLSNNIIELRNPDGNTYWNKQTVHPTDEFLALIKNEKYEPSFNSNFPASKISTKLDWDDLVLPYDTMKELEEIEVWLKYRDYVESHKHLGKILKPGFRSLFYGPPGTGKTLTASLLGKQTGLDVYRVDLSMVVSKWVGETEKNLKRIFDIAQNKNWILFFDEADSLFGKRAQNKSANDRHANQEVAYLLQRIEDFPGLVLLATNLKDNIDEAFARRFQSMVNFPLPDPETRLVLWQKAIPDDFKLEDTIDLQTITNDYEMSGGVIINVVRYCALMALNRNDKIFLEEDIENGIAREFRKIGKIVG